MSKRLFLNKWTIVVCIAVIAGTCFILYQYSSSKRFDKYLESEQQQLDALRENQLNTPSNNSDIKSTNGQLDQNESNKSDDINDISNHTNNINANNLNDDLDQDDQSLRSVDVPKTSSSNNDRVSPFGFGKYPDIPETYRDLGGVEDIWGYFEKLAETDPDTAREQELAERVMIKLWSQGKHAIGGKTINGKFYPDFPNTVYVEWDTEKLEDGTIERFPVRVGGDPSFSAYEMEFFDSDGTEFPSRFTMLDYDKDGINPYEFLNLER